MTVEKCRALLEVASEMVARVTSQMLRTDNEYADELMRIYSDLLVLTCEAFPVEK